MTTLYQTVKILYDDAMCNRAEGQSSDENHASKQHSKYSTADECGRNERSMESCSSDSSGRSECNIVSFGRDDSIECRWPLRVDVQFGFRDDDRAKL